MAEFTGGDPYAVHHLPRDEEFLIELQLPERVHVTRIVVDQRLDDQPDRIRPIIRQRLRLSSGTELSFGTAGDRSKPAVLLLHGFPGSARTFRDVMPELSQAAYVIAPELPGFGKSDVLPTPTFPAFGQGIAELLDHCDAGTGTSLGPNHSERQRASNGRTHGVRPVHDAVAVSGRGEA